MQNSTFRRSRASIAVFHAILSVMFGFLFWSITWAPLERRLAGKPPVGGTSLETALVLDAILLIMAVSLSCAGLSGYLVCCSEEGIRWRTLRGRVFVRWEDVRKVEILSSWSTALSTAWKIELETPDGDVEINSLHLREPQKAFAEILRRVPSFALPPSSPG